MNEAIQQSPGLTYRPEEHELIEPGGQYIETLRSLSGKKDFFLYRHRIHDTWVIAYWWQAPKNGKKGVMCELCAFQSHPDSLPIHPDPDSMPELQSNNRYGAMPQPRYLLDETVGPVSDRYNQLMKDLNHMVEAPGKQEELDAAELKDIGDHLATRGPIKNQDHPAVKMLQKGKLPVNFVQE